VCRKRQQSSRAPLKETKTADEPWGGRGPETARRGARASMLFGATTAWRLQRSSPCSNDSGACVVVWVPSANVTPGWVASPGEQAGNPSGTAELRAGYSGSD
jgi:hypothetical protein